jgi:hypothetical protein
VSPAQRAIAAIVAVITAVLLVESYGAMVDAAREGGRAIPELWPLGTEALALAMEVSVLEAKRLGQRAVLALSWVLLAASVALSTVLQVAVAPPTLVGYVTAGATPVWLLGSFAVLSLLYRAGTTIGAQASTGAQGAETGAGGSSSGAGQAPSSAEPEHPGAEDQPVGAEALTKRALAERAYAALSAEGAPVTGAQLAETVGLSASYARALAAEFQARPPAPARRNGHPTATAAEEVTTG